MFAAGLASVLSREKRTVLVDLDLNSTHRNLLEREECPGISNLAMVIEEITPLSFVNIVQRHPSGFDVLPGLKAPEEDGLVSEVNLKLIFKLLSQSYELVVLDISSNHRLITMGALRHCSLVFLVMHPDLLSLRCALRAVELSGRCGGGSIRWGLAMNRSGAGDLVQPFQVSEVLGVPLLAILPDDPVAGEDFSNFMRPGPGDGPYRAALEQMAVRLRLKEGSTSTINKSLSARCLRALKGRPGERRVTVPDGGGLPRSGEGLSCAR